ncbi:hypothetical protein [Roseomonas chloroacetimidivorans]|jgi:hypothetical protein|uniref:hypothetical protein n=1 Tax=Roseomonas chloroacetimidivorans TaxID=1766656 RepID=UPI003C789C43
MADPKVQNTPGATWQRETGGWTEGVQPGVGRGAELDESLKDGVPESDPAMRSAIPGFVDRADSTEDFVEGPGVAEARNAIEDLPRQG